MIHDINDSVSYFMIPPRHRGKLPEDIIESFDDIIEQCPTKRYATTPYGKFLFDVPNKRIYMVYRRYDMMSVTEFMKSLSTFVELCRKKGFTFYYEPAISN